MSNNPENPTINASLTGLFRHKIKVFKKVDLRFGIDPKKYFELTFLRRLQILFSPSIDSEFIHAFELPDFFTGQSLDSKTLEISEDAALKIFKTFLAAVLPSNVCPNDTELKLYFDSVYKPESSSSALEFLKSVGIQPVEN